MNEGTNEGTNRTNEPNEQTDGTPPLQRDGTSLVLVVPAPRQRVVARLHHDADARLSSRRVSVSVDGCRHAVSYPHLRHRGRVVGGEGGGVRVAAGDELHGGGLVVSYENSFFDPRL